MPNHLANALDFAQRARLTRDERERERLLALAAKHREMAIAEAVPFVLAMPKWAAVVVGVARALKRKWA